MAYLFNVILVLFSISPTNQADTKAFLSPCQSTH